MRFGWTPSGSTAVAVKEANTLPDTTRWTVEAKGAQIGYAPTFVDSALGAGGLDLDSDSYVDVELSTASLTTITHVTAALFGRSLSAATDGSFAWQTLNGQGAAPANLVTHTAPYRWYRADATAAFIPGESGALFRLKVGPASNHLAVNRVELCLDAH